MSSTPPVQSVRYSSKKPAIRSGRWAMTPLKFPSTPSARGMRGSAVSPTGPTISMMRWLMGPPAR